MEITWLGYSCFRLKGSQGIVITDPYSPDLGLTMPKQSGRIVTVSHEHKDHSFTQAVEGQFRVISRPGEYEVATILINGMRTYHDAVHGVERGKNTVFTISLDEIIICHLGDLGHALSSSQAEQIGPVDILLVPVGGGNTINASLAAQVVRQLEPKIVIPMHYQTLMVRRELEPVDPFLKEMGSKEIVPQPKLTVNKSSLPLTLQVVVLSC